MFNLTGVTDIDLQILLYLDDIDDLINVYNVSKYMRFLLDDTNRFKLISNKFDLRGYNTMKEVMSILNINSLKTLLTLFIMSFLQKEVRAPPRADLAPLPFISSSFLWVFA